MDTPTFWRKCTTCKNPIAFGQKYWLCSVSTCNRQRTGLIFCSVSCFDAHIPVMNHRDAGAFEKRAPSLAEWQREQAAANAPAPSTPCPSGAARSSSGASATPRSSGVGGAASAATSGRPTSETVGSPAESEDEILVVVSKVKAYIRARSGMNTSDSVMRLLSVHLRREMKDAVRRAAQEDRKTVLDRDCRE